jgi:hypothetical protein
MNPNTIREMAPHTKRRFHFAASAFVRMWGHGSLKDNRIIDFCVEWAQRTENAPLDNSILDQYFYFEFKTWRGY